MRFHRGPAAPPRGRAPSLHALAGRWHVRRSQPDPGSGVSWQEREEGEPPGCRELFSPEQIPGGGRGGGRGPISGPFSSWAAALRFVRSHSPAMTTAFSNPHAPFERDPCGSRFHEWAAMPRCRSQQGRAESCNLSAFLNPSPPPGQGPGFLPLDAHWSYKDSLILRLHLTSQTQICAKGP